MGQIIGYKRKYEINICASGDFVLEARQTVDFLIGGPRAPSGILDMDQTTLVTSIRIYLDEAVAFHKDERVRKVLYGYRFELFAGPEREFSTLFLDAVDTKLELKAPIPIGARQDVRVRLCPIDSKATFEPVTVRGKVIVQGHCSRDYL